MSAHHPHKLFYSVFIFFFASRANPSQSTRQHDDTTFEESITTWTACQQHVRHLDSQRSASKERRLLATLPSIIVPSLADLRSNKIVVFCRVNDIGSPRALHHQYRGASFAVLPPPKGIYREEECILNLLVLHSRPREEPSRKLRLNLATGRRCHSLRVRRATFQSSTIDEGMLVLFTTAPERNE